MKRTAGAANQVNIHEYEAPVRDGGCLFMSRLCQTPVKSDMKVERQIPNLSSKEMTLSSVVFPSQLCRPGELRQKDSCIKG